MTALPSLTPARERLDRLLVKCPTGGLRFPVNRSANASANEFATDVAAAPDDPHALPTTCHEQQGFQPDPALLRDRAPHSPHPPQEMDLPPAYLAISDEGDECIVKRFDSKTAAEGYAREAAAQSGGDVGCIVMPTKVAFAALSTLDACKRALRLLEGVAAEDERNGKRNAAMNVREVERALRTAVGLALGVPADNVPRLLAIEADEARHVAAVRREVYGEPHTPLRPVELGPDSLDRVSPHVPHFPHATTNR